MSDLDVRVRKAASAHYFSVFDGIRPLVSGEVKAGKVELYAPVGDLEDEVAAAVLAKCAAVDAELAEWEAGKERKRKARAKPAPVTVVQDPPAPKAAPKKGARS